MRSVYVETTIDSEMKIYASPKNKGKFNYYKTMNC
ncbi:hypothetical protein J2S19_004551 [Metabacillus malikii]|uniref:Uncharacterized protein n=1 Tax=Metabacillus malikii TaxID=1504265 RepID=A0ABT9ZMS3_9BACI|nr:hypothetical protein [Metabacillus malikii]